MVHRRKFIQYLRNYGIVCIRTTGKHHIFQDKRGVNYSVSLHTKDVSLGVVRNVAKHFDIPIFR